MGLTVSVYANPQGDCTGGGISSKVIQLCIVNITGPSQPDEDSPAAMMVAGNAPGLVKIVPASYNEERNEWSSTPGWAMMGGNYASTSDSRFHEAVKRFTGHPSYGAVPIHDRIEK